MALVHEFKIIDSLNEINCELSKNDGIVLSDFTMQYISDSLYWIKSSWNNTSVKMGLNYYGFSIVTGREIIRLKDILESWTSLFMSSPDEFYLIGNYNIDEGDYEREKISKKYIINELISIEHLCKKAIKEEKNILHLGI